MRAILLLLSLIISMSSFSQDKEGFNLNQLSPFEKSVIIDKGTEYPFTGEYTDHKADYHRILIIYYY